MDHSKKNYDATQMRANLQNVMNAERATFSSPFCIVGQASLVCIVQAYCGRGLNGLGWPALPPLMQPTLLPKFK